jgi:hypothetical protein
MSEFPVLYAFENDPESILARAGLLYARETIELRRISDENIDQAPVDLSHSKPVLTSADDKLLKSGGIEISKSALSKNDPDQLLTYDQDQAASFFDKVQSTYTDYKKTESKDKLIPLLETIEQNLQGQRYLVDANISFLDITTFPYIRELNDRNTVWFDGLVLPRLHQWITDIGYSKTFQTVTRHVQPWQKNDTPVIIAPWGI